MREREKKRDQMRKSMTHTPACVAGRAACSSNCNVICVFPAPLSPAISMIDCGMSAPFNVASNTEQPKDRDYGVMWCDVMMMVMWW